MRNLTLCLLLFACGSAGFTGGSGSGSGFNNSGSSVPTDPTIASQQQTPVGAGSGLNTPANSGNVFGLPLNSEGTIDCRSLNARSAQATSSTAYTILSKSVSVDPQGRGKHANEDSVAANVPVDSNATALERTDIEPLSQILQRVDPTSLGLVESIDILGFAHQYGSGLDSVKIAVTSGGQTSETNMVSNVNSAYGYGAFKNIQKVNGEFVGDFELSAFPYSPQAANASFLRGASGIDGTTWAKPAAGLGVTPILRTAVRVSDLRISVHLGAKSYDSRQFRAVRVVMWAKPGFCR